MAFSSESSKNQARKAVNKLLAKHLPGSQIEAEKPSSKASASVVLNQLRRKQNSDEIKRIVKNQKLRERKKILKTNEESKKFNKIAKYNLIKSHKKEGTLSVEESKYLKKLIKKNVSSLNSLSEIDDESMKDEMRETKHDILEILDSRTRRPKKNKKNAAENDFKTKIKKGYISYPGLTPGLAPVDYEESDEE